MSAPNTRRSAVGIVARHEVLVSSRTASPQGDIVNARGDTGASLSLPAAAEAIASAHGVDRPLSVAFFDFINKPPHLETAFEFIERHLARGDIVSYTFLGHDVPHKDFLSPVPGSIVFGPWLPERAAARLITHRNFTFTPRCRLPVQPLPFDVPDTLQALMGLTHEGFDVGMAVASSLITQTRNSRFDPRKHSAAVQRALQGSLATFTHVYDALTQDRPDLVYIFNGRFAYERAVLRACQQLGVPFLIHERGSTQDRFFLRPYTPHDRERVQREVRAAWNAAKVGPDGVAEATQWFVERREGQPQDWPSFTERQSRDELPFQDTAKRIIAYFSSSDDEFVAIGDEYRWEGWSDQLDAVHALIRVVDGLDDAMLVVRIHPHMCNKHRSERDRWLALESSSPKVSIIPPESNVDTYALIEAADVVVTAGSTVGAEAVYWGRPSVLLGPSEYDGLGVAHRANDPATLTRLLSDRSLPVHRDAALAYGYHRATYGEHFNVYRPYAFSQGVFKGTHLRSLPWRVLAEARRRIAAQLGALWNAHRARGA